LYVDDDENIRKQTSSMLNRLFNVVDIAVDGVDALNKYKNDSYDIVISDVSMPKMNGIELSQKIKEYNPKQKIILITALDNKECLYKVLDIGVDGFVPKPIDIPLFLKTIKKISFNISSDKLAENFQNILEEQLEEKIAELMKKTYFDRLTGLRNRVALEKYLEENENEVICLINIDNFDSINIVYGYEKGDEILKKFASRLREKIDKNSAFYLGADEFVIIEDEFDMEKIEKLHQYMNFKIGIISVTNTIGVSGQGLKKAFIALKEAKQTKNIVKKYSTDLEIEKLHQKIQKYLPIIEDAIEEDRIIPFYQGIRDNKTGKIEKYEVLARLKYDEETLSPFYFIDVAQKAGLIHTITKIIIDKSFNYMKDKNCQFSINLTEDDLKDDDIVRYFIDKTKEYNIDPRRVIIEVLEGIENINNDVVLKKLSALKDYGFLISIDDFGTMNSNFERVISLNVDFIKIDGSFIKNIDKDETSLAIVKSIKYFTNSINAKVIAEFVASKEVLDIVESLGIEYSQGYLFSEPKPEIIKE